MSNTQTPPEDYKKEVKRLLREMEAAFNEYSNKMGNIWIEIQQNLKELE